MKFIPEQNFNGLIRFLICILILFFCVSFGSENIVLAASPNTNSHDQTVLQKIWHFVTSPFSNDTSKNSRPTLEEQVETEPVDISSLSQKIDSLEQELKDIQFTNSNSSGGDGGYGGSGVISSLSKSTTYIDLLGYSILDSFGNIYPSNAALAQSTKPSLGTGDNRYYGLYLNNFIVPGTGIGGGVVLSNTQGQIYSGQVDLGSNVTGTLPTGNGGTGQTSYTTGDILYANTTNNLAKMGIGSSGQVLTVSNGVPSWTTIGTSSCPTCLISNPSSTQTITPSSSTAIGLSVAQASGGSVDIFNITNNAGSTNYFKVDSSGNTTIQGSTVNTGTLNLSGAITAPTSSNTINSLVINSGALSGITGYTQASGSFSATGLSSASLSVTAGTLALATATSGNITLTTGAASGLTNILTGNLKVGNGTPTLTQDGEDAYVEGTFEVDGVSTFGGNVGIGITNPGQKLVVSGGRGIIDLSGTVSPSTTNTLGIYEDYTPSSYLNGQAHLELARASNTGRALRFGYTDTAGGLTLGWIQSVVPGPTGSTLALNPGGGNVGIGTTAPTFLFSAVGAQSTADRGIAAITNNNTTDSSNTVTLRLNTGATSTTTNARFTTFYAGVTSGDTGGTAVGHINLNNNAVNYGTSGADYGERFYIPEKTEPGDVIAIANDNNVKAVKGQKILGVVSDTAGFTGNDRDDFDKSTHPVVGLLGQVGVKVSTENGEIKRGDYITASNIPGVAMKATQAGDMIGKAIEDYNGQGVKRVQVYVNPGYADPNNLFANLNFVIGNDGTLVQLSDPATANTILNKNNTVVSTTSQTTAQADFQNSEKLQTLSARLDQLEEKITNLFKGLTEFLGAVIFRSDVTFVGRPVFNEDTAGTAIIKKDSDSVDIVFNKEYEKIPVITKDITLDKQGDSDEEKKALEDLEKTIFNEDIKSLVTNRTTKGFTIKLNKKAPVDIEFSWTALAIKNIKETVSETKKSSETPSDNLTQDASSSAIPQPTVTPSPSASPKSDKPTVKILSNDLGFLRVRKEPNSDSEEIGQVKPDQIFSILKEQYGFYQIEYAEGKNGWVSSTYTVKE